MSAPGAPQDGKARIVPEAGDPLPCLFNPSEFKLSKSNTWEARKGSGTNAQQLRFKQGGSGTLNLSLTFDTTATGSPVTDHTNRLLQLMQISDDVPGSDQSRNNGRPPWVQFHWGDFHSFKAIIEKLDLTFTYFASNGTALRAKAAISLKQYEDDDAWPPQNPTSGTPLPHRMYQVQPGETIDRIAGLQIGDPTRWRELAEANGVTNPFDLVPGDLLMIPRAQAVARAR